MNFFYSILLLGALTLIPSCAGNSETKNHNLVTIPKVDISKLPTINYPLSYDEQDNPVVIDLKNLKEGEIVNTSFAIKNVGNKPLIIRNVVTGCGCTSVKYDRKPLKSNDTAIVKLTFDSKGQFGAQMKTIEIISTDNIVTFIKLKANVD